MTRQLEWKLRENTNSVKEFKETENNNIYESYLDGLDTVVDVFLLLKWITHFESDRDQGRVMSMKSIVGLMIWLPVDARLVLELEN